MISEKYEVCNVYKVVITLCYVIMVKYLKNIFTVENKQLFNIILFNLFEVGIVI